MLTYCGWMRLHWNKGETERPWCISLESGWQLEVKTLSTNGVLCTWVLIEKPIPDEDDGKPRAWVDTYGVLNVDCQGHAVIERVLN